MTRIDEVLGIIGKVEVEETLPQDIDASGEKSVRKPEKPRIGRKPTPSEHNESQGHRA